MAKNRICVPVLCLLFLFKQLFLFLSLDIVVYLCLQHIIHTFQSINRFVFCLDDRLLVIQIFAECLILYHQIGTDRHVADKVVVSGNVVRLEFAVLSKIIQGHAEKIRGQLHKSVDAHHLPN